jgi:hypothetical protein
MARGKTNQRARILPAAAGLVLLSTFADSAFAATTVTPGIGALALWSDNIDLAPPGQELGGEAWQVTPSLDFLHDSGYEHAAFHYELKALFFSGGYHDLFQDGNLFSETKVVPEWLLLDIAGARTQGLVNPTVPADLDYLFPTGNIANYTYGTVRPILRHTFRLVRAEVSYARSLTNDQQVGAVNPLDLKSDERDTAVNLASVDPGALITWAAEYQDQAVHYESPFVEVYRYERAGAEVGGLVTQSIRLLARGGKESDPRDGFGVGGLGSAYWAGGFDWSPDKQNELRLLVGRRFYGNWFDGLWRRQSRLLTVLVTYVEEPTTQDALTLQGLLVATPPPAIPGTPIFTLLTPAVFLDKHLNATAVITGRLTQIGVSVASDQRTYLSGGSNTPILNAPQPGYDDHVSSATLFVKRRLGPLTEASVSATYGKYNLQEGTLYLYTDQIYSAALNHSLGQRTNLQLRVDHEERHDTGLAYKTNIVSLGIQMNFGRPAFGNGNAQGQGAGAQGNEAPGNLPQFPILTR